MKQRNWRDITGDYARVYTDFRGGFAPQTIRYILRRADLPRRAVVIDLATGAGAVLRQMARSSCFSAGLDASILMLRQNQAEQRADGSNIPLACADGEQLPLPANSIDLITIGQAIHWFDLPVLFAELMRVLRPGGMLVVLSRYPSPAGWLSPLAEQVRYPFTEEGRVGTPQWGLSSAPSNLLGLEQAGFTGYERRVIANRMILSLEGYLQGQADRARRLDLSSAELERYLDRLRAALIPHATDGWLRELFLDYVFTVQKPR